jgi:hypothetical protein
MCCCCRLSPVSRLVVIGICWGGKTFADVCPRRGGLPLLYTLAVSRCQTFVVVVVATRCYGHASQDLLPFKAVENQVKYGWSAFTFGTYYTNNEDQLQAPPHPKMWPGVLVFSQTAVHDYSDNQIMPRFDAFSYMSHAWKIHTDKRPLKTAWAKRPGILYKPMKNWPMLDVGKHS